MQCLSSHIVGRCFAGFVRGALSLHRRLVAMLCDHIHEFNWPLVFFCFFVDKNISQIIVWNMSFRKRKHTTQTNHTSILKHTTDFKKLWTLRIHKIRKSWKYKEEEIWKPGYRETYNFQKVRGLNFLELLESNPANLGPAAPGRLWSLNENHAILQENSIFLYLYNIVPSLWPRTSKITYRSYGFICSAYEKNRPFRVWKLDFFAHFGKMQKCE